MKKIGAVILAGGKSRRIGRDKALIPIDNLPLIDILLKRLKKVFNDIIIISEQKPDYLKFGLKVFEDIIKGCGPLGGIHSGLVNSNLEQNFFFACDMPFVNMELVQYMSGSASDFDVVIPRVGRKLEPLHCIYSKACIEPIEKQLEKGDRKIINFFPDVKIRYVEEEEIRKFDPDFLSFYNINTPEDYRHALEKVRK